MTSASAVGDLRVIRVDDRTNSELLQDPIGHRRRAAGQRVRAARHLREGDYLSQVGLAGHAGDETIDAHGEPAVRRRAHRQGLEQEAELLLLLLLPDAHHTEDRLLPLGVVDPDRARAELPAVPDQVVVLAQRRAWILLATL